MVAGSLAAPIGAAALSGPSGSPRRALGRLSSPAAERERDLEWALAEEEPVALAYNGRSRAVMMATPADFEDFAFGFALTEGVIDDLLAVEGVVVERQPRGTVVDLRLDARRLAAQRLKRRTIAGRTGCGLCGVESLESAVRRPPRVRAGFTLTAEAVQRAFAQLPAWQLLNRINRSVHAAGWCSPSGDVLAVREDVGRHNALDKLIGGLRRTGRESGPGFVVMTSRCSFELVQKAATAGIAHLATISAPTALALDLAAEAGMTLAARAGTGVMLFAAPDGAGAAGPEPQWSEG